MLGTHVLGNVILKKCVSKKYPLGKWRLEQNERGKGKTTELSAVVNRQGVKTHRTSSYIVKAGAPPSRCTMCLLTLG